MKKNSAGKYNLGNVPDVTQEAQQGAEVCGFQSPGVSPEFDGNVDMPVGNHRQVLLSSKQT